MRWCRAHIHQRVREGSFLARWRNFDSSLFVALFDFLFTEIAFTYALRTKIKQISKCLSPPFFYESLENSLFHKIHCTICLSFLHLLLCFTWSFSDNIVSVKFFPFWSFYKIKFFLASNRKIFQMLKEKKKYSLEILQAKFNS